MKHKRIIIINSILAVAVIVSLVINSASSSLRAVSLPEGTDVSPSAALQIVFNENLDSQAPYLSFTLSPQAEGVVKVNGAVIEFQPRFRLSDKTEYQLTIAGVRSASGKYKETVSQRFKTGTVRLSSFERSLPINGDGFSIELLETGHVTVFVFGSPADQKEATARKLLRDGGIADERILVERTASSEF